MVGENILEYPAAKLVSERIPGALVEGKFEAEELTLVVDAGRILDVCKLLKLDGKFVRLSGITAVDWFPADPRFEVVYHLHNLETHFRLRLKAQLSEGTEIESATGVWRAANWYEREIFDMFGIQFLNHPDLTRILMPEDWEGHPLRKDFPIDGRRYSYQTE